MKTFCHNPECEIEIDGYDVEGREIGGKMFCVYCAGGRMSLFLLRLVVDGPRWPWPLYYLAPWVFGLAIGRWPHRIYGEKK